MGKKIDVDGWTINDILEAYIENELYVDQRYQRKLVWSLEDKVLFIDSFGAWTKIQHTVVRYSDTDYRIDIFIFLVDSIHCQASADHIPFGINNGHESCVLHHLIEIEDSELIE